MGILRLPKLCMQRKVTLMLKPQTAPHTRLISNPRPLQLQTSLFVRTATFMLLFSPLCTSHLPSPGLLSRVHINKYFCVLYLIQICACVNKFVWTCAPHMNVQKKISWHSTHTIHSLSVFFLNVKDVRRNIVSVDVSVNVQCSWWTFMLPRAHVDQRRTAYIFM